MVESRLGPLGVLLHTRRVGDAQLLCHEVQDHRRYVQRILQERPNPPNRDQLKTEAELHVLAAAALD
jgi:hypothetical protein